MNGDGYARVVIPELRTRSSGELRPWRAEEREAMGELLRDWPWRIFCTWTFAERIGEEGALREVKAWLGFLGWAMRRDVGWMIGVEQDHGAEWPHVHGLVCGGRLADRVTMYAGKPHERVVPLIEPYWRGWFDRHGSRGKFEVIESTTATTFYCAKYAGKRGAVIFSDGLERFRGRGAALAPVKLFPEQLVMEGRDGVAGMGEV